MSMVCNQICKLVYATLTFRQHMLCCCTLHVGLLLKLFLSGLLGWSCACMQVPTYAPFLLNHALLGTHHAMQSHDIPSHHLVLSLVPSTALYTSSSQHFYLLHKVLPHVIPGLSWIEGGLCQMLKIVALHSTEKQKPTLRACQLSQFVVASEEVVDCILPPDWVLSISCA